ISSFGNSVSSIGASPSTPTDFTTMTPSRPATTTNSARPAAHRRRIARGVNLNVERHFLGFFPIRLVGCRHYDGQAMENQQLQAVRSRNNKFDRNAIRVEDNLRRTIGHIAARPASKLAPLLDRNEIAVHVYATGRKGTFECPALLKIFGPLDIGKKLLIFDDFRSVGLDYLVGDDLREYGERFPSLTDLDNVTVNIAHTPPEYAFDDDQDDIEVMLGKSLAFDPRLMDLTTESYGTPEDVMEGMIKAETPVQLRTELLPHQRQGLAWMLKQELPVLPAAGSQDTVQLWRRWAGNQFRNIATGVIEEAPTLASGGILADDMGLGKTLQVIALILTAQKPLSSRSAKSTLIICPLGVMSNWKDQLATHVKEEHSLNVLIYHGPGKRDTTRLRQYDVVITTYNAMSNEYGNNKGVIEKGLQPPNGLFSIHWRRVVLDEGHTIRNQDKRLAQSAYNLRADSRWSLTGTPIVNRLTDLYSQIKFLKLSGGLENLINFKLCIIEPLESGREEVRAKARKLLQTMMGAICLRRRKDMKFMNLKLPKLSSHLLRIKLTKTEQEKYDALRDEARGLLALYRDREGEDLRSIYVNILEVLLRLRQCCNHWRLCENRLNSILQLLDSKPISSLTEESIKLLQAMLQIQIESEEICSICLNSLRDKDPVVTVCKHCFCRPCIEEWFDERKTCPLCRQPSGVHFIVGPAEEMAEDESMGSDYEDSSSKINALLKILTAKGQSPDTKTVVFSQWTSFLDIFEKQLVNREISFARIDGKKKASERDEAIEMFSKNKSCTVMLASLSVCSVGLNLIAANQVILADSWWAPAVEDQAVDRVYRLGQTRATTIWRLVVENSIEDRVLEVQKKKRELMSAAFKEKEFGLSREARIADIQRLISS
ncbi:hypothetical protein KEM54_005187, partial [Ascosphaera aggregata]